MKTIYTGLSRFRNYLILKFYIIWLDTRAFTFGGSVKLYSAEILCMVINQPYNKVKQTMIELILTSVFF